MSVILIAIVCHCIELLAVPLVMLVQAARLAPLAVTHWLVPHTVQAAPLVKPALSLRSASPLATLSLARPALLVTQDLAARPAPSVAGPLLAPNNALRVLLALARPLRQLDLPHAILFPHQTLLRICSCLILLISHALWAVFLPYYVNALLRMRR